MISIDTLKTIRTWCEQNPPRPLEAVSAWAVHPNNVQKTVDLLRGFGWTCNMPKWGEKLHNVIVVFSYEN